jgi:hypothetical protein
VVERVEPPKPAAETCQQRRVAEPEQPRELAALGRARVGGDGAKQRVDHPELTGRWHAIVGRGKRGAD